MPINYVSFFSKSLYINGFIYFTFFTKNSARNNKIRQCTLSTYCSPRLRFFQFKNISVTCAAATAMPNITAAALMNKFPIIFETISAIKATTSNIVT